MLGPASSSELLTHESPQSLDLPGMQLVDPDLDRIRGQVVYLDFDGEEDVSYDNDALGIYVSDVDMTPFALEGALAGREHEVIDSVLANLNADWAEMGVRFVANSNASRKIYGKGSTIYIGGDNHAFDHLAGDFLGLAETLDVGNQENTNEGFVFFDKLGTFDSACTAANTISHVVEHELGQLLGFEHEDAAQGALEDFGYSGTVYWGARDIDWTLWGIAVPPANPVNHHFIVIEFYGSAPTWEEIVDLDNGNKALVVGGFNQEGVLTTDYADYVNIDADLRAANDWFAMDFDRWNPELHVLDVPYGHDFDSFTTVLYELTQAYDNTINFALGWVWEYAQNCATYVNTMMAKAGVPDDVRIEKGEFSGVDWGEENLLYPGHFKYMTGLTRGASSVVQGTDVRLTATTRATGALQRVDFHVDSNGNGVFEPDTDEKIGTDWNPSNGSSWNVSTDGLAVGKHWFFARAWDNLGDYFVFDSHSDNWVEVAAPDTSPPQVALNAISTDFWQPTVFDTSLVSVSGTASDPESGVVSDGFEFHTARWQEATRDWVDWADHGRGASSQLLGPFEDGKYMISLTAQNGAGLEWDSSIGYFRIETAQSNQLPRIDSLSADPHTVEQGDSITLTAYGVRDGDGSVQRVEFYRDSDGNGYWDTGDVSLGGDTSVSNETASVSFSTGGLSTGTYWFFARALDDDNAWTHSAATTTAFVASATNQAPGIASLSAPASVEQGDLLTLTAIGVDDPDGSVRYVHFYRDSNGNGTWDTGDEYLGKDTSIYGQQGSIAIWAAFPVGPQRFFAWAEDNEGSPSPVRSTTVEITGAPGSDEPVVHWVSRSPGTVDPGDDLVVSWFAEDDVNVHHIGLYLYQGFGTSDVYKVDTTPYVAGGSADGRLAANAIDWPNTGSYTWMVPANLPPADDYRIKVVAWDDQLSDDKTDFKFTDYFTVADDLPYLTKLVSDRGSVIEGQGQTVTFTATVSATDGADYVRFVRDTNGDHQLDGGDELLGNGTISGVQASVSYNTAGLSQGEHTFIAQLRLDDGTWGNRRIRKLTVTGRSNQPPTAGSLYASPTNVVRGDNITLTLNGISDDTGIAYAQFLWDFDGSGDGSGSDSVIGYDTTVGGSHASITIASTSLDLGSQQIIARARDEDGAWSAWKSTTVTIDPPSVAAPFIGELDPSSDFQPHAITLTITATDVTGSTNVLFYHDSNNNGSLDSNDQLLIDDDDGSNGWWWRNSPQNMGFPVGLNRFFAVGKNQYGQLGNIVQTVVTTHPTDQTAPQATSDPPDITADGGTQYDFQVVYTDNIAVDTFDMDNLDIRVIGPGDLWSDEATFVTVDDFSEGPERTATYRIDAPGGTWDAFDNGEYRVFLKNRQVRDTNGNFAPSAVIATFSVAIPFDDSTAPVVVLDDLSDDINDPTPQTAQDVSVSGSASDAQSGVVASSYEFSVNYFDGSAWSGWVDHPDDDGYKTLSSLADGLYAVFLSAVNGAGLTGQSTTKYFLVDTVSPSKPTVNGLSIDTGQSDSDQITSLRSPTFTWTEANDDGTGVAGYWWNVDDPSPESGGTFTASGHAAPLVPIEGVHTFYVRAEDGAGNLGSVASLSFTIDATSPIVSSITPANGSTVGNGPAAILVDFSETIDETTLSNGALSLSGPGLGSASVTSSSCVDSDTARFTIGGVWAEGTVVAQLVSGELRDVAGNTLVDYTDGAFVIDHSTVPKIVVKTSADQVISDGNYTVDFGTVEQGETPPTMTFTVQNEGDGTLTLESISLPTGFSVTEDLATSIGPANSDTFTIQLDTDVAGPKSGQLRFSNNDSDESPFNFVIAGEVTSPAETGRYGWATGIGGTSLEMADALASDGTGNLYVTGIFQGSTDFDPGPGEAVRTSNDNSRDIFVAKYTSNGALVWVETYGGTTSNDCGLDIAVDDSGNVYVTGAFGGTVDFGGYSRTSNGNNDTFALKLNSLGDAVWAFSTDGNSSGQGIAVDALGNVYVAGRFEGSVDFGGNERTAIGSWDAYLLKLSSSGNTSWVRHMGGPSDEVAYDVAVDASGNAYTTGKFALTTDFDRDGSAANRTSQGGDDIFVAKHTQSGSLAWVHGIGGSSSEQGWAVAVDQDQNVFATGSFRNTVDFNPQSGEASVTSEGSADTFVLKLDTNGGFGWVHQIGGASGSAGYDIYADRSQGVYVTGYFEGTADFDTTESGYERTSVGQADIFVAKLESSGGFGWAQSMGGGATDQGKGIAVDSVGSVYTTGHFNGKADFDPGNGTAELTSVGSSDVFLSQLVVPPPVTNQAPVLSAISNKTVNEGTALSFSASASDPDGPSQTLTYSLDAGAPSGATINPSTGAFTWTPAEAIGPYSDQVTVRVTDDGSPAFSDTATFTITVNEVNQAPSIASIADATVARGDTLAFQATASDPDVPENRLTFALDSGAPTAATIDSSTGEFSWTVGVLQQPGDYSIRVRVTDDGTPTDSDVEEFTVTVVNNVPTISNIANRSINEDADTGAISLSIGDFETPLNALLVTGTSSNTTLVPNNGISFQGTGADRTVTITPAANQSGTATITVTVTDADGGSASDTFQLTVTAENDLPTISDISDKTIVEDVPSDAYSFTVGDVETSTADLLVTGSSSNTSLVPDGNIVFGGSGPDRTVTVSPLANQFGTATITVTVTDGDGGSTPDTFELTVTAENDLPTISDIANQTITEDGSTGALAFIVGDVETAAAGLLVTGSSSNTSLVPNGNIVFGGSGPNRTVTVSPLANQFGTATITVTVTDADGGTVTDTFTLTVLEESGSPGVTVTPSGAGTDVTEEGATDSYTIALDTVPTGPVEITVSADSQSEISLDGTTFAPSVTFTRTDTTAQTVTVRAVDDAIVEGNHTSTITHAITGTINDPDYPTSLGIDTVTVTITDNDALLANLRIQSLEVRYPPLSAGDSFTLAYAIENVGLADAVGSFVLGAFLSKDSVISLDDVRIGEAVHTGLEHNWGTTGFVYPVLPAAGDSFWSGTGMYYIGLIVDTEDTVHESIEQDNMNRGEGIDKEAVSITVSADAPEIDVEIGGNDDVHSHDFGNVTVEQSASASFTVRNEGTATLTVSQASGLNAPFAISPANDAGGGDDWAIDPGGTRQFTVTFTPGAATSYSDTLTLASNDSDESNYQISLTGTGTAAPNLRIQSLEVRYPPLSAGDSFTLAYAIENVGLADTVESFVLGAFLSKDSVISLDDVRIGETVHAGLEHNWGTTGFVYPVLPAASDSFWSGSGTYYIGLIVDTEDTVRESIEQDNMNRGEGIDKEAVSITVSADVPDIDVEIGGNDDVHSHAFGNVTVGQSASATFTVRNEGTATLTVSQASGLNTPFAITPANGAGSGDDWTIASGETRDFVVTFTPSAATSYSDTLTLVSNDSDESNYQISLAGTGDVSTETGVVIERTGTVYATVNEAMSAASNGDTLLLKDGIYSETLVANKELTFRAMNVGEAILDGGAATALIDVQANTTIEGIWLRNAGFGVLVRSGASYECVRCIASDFTGAAFSVNTSLARTGTGEVVNSVILDSASAVGINDGDSIRIRNSIIDNVATAYVIHNGNSIIASHNILHNVVNRASGTVADDPAEIIGDPLFVDRAGYDFRLQGTSPAIDSGTDVGLPFEGSAPDRGAFESTDTTLTAPVLSIGTVTDTTVELVWTDSNIEIGYHVFQDGSILKSVPKDSSGTTIVNLSPNTTYEFLVQAYTYGLAETADSNEVVVTTLLTAVPDIDVEIGGNDDVHGHAFGDVAVGQSASATFTVRNEGTAALTISQASGLNLPFSISPANGAGSGDDWTIASGETRNFTVTFTPSAATSYSDTLTLVSNDSDESNYQISLTGTGTNVSARKIDVELLVVSTVTGADESAVLPMAVSTVSKGNTFYVEVWTKNVDGSANGITGGYLDFSFDAALATAGAIDHGGLYTNLAMGSIDNTTGRVDDLGGNANPGVVDKGDDEWVRLGYVTFVADAEGTLNLTAAAGIDTFARAGEAAVDWADVELNSPAVSVTIEAGCLYDIDGNGRIGTGDYSYLSAAWLSEPGDAHWDARADFDQNGRVGTSDYSWLSSNWLKYADDPTIAYPPAGSGFSTGSFATMAADAASPSIDVELIALSTASATDEAATLPTSASSVTEGDTFYVEVWVKNADGSANGITGGYLDFSFDTTLATAGSIDHGGLYTNLAMGSIDNTTGRVDDLGGNANPGVVDKGDDEWVRLGYVTFVADAQGTLNLTAAAGIDTFARAGEGAVDWADVELNTPQASITIEEAPSPGVSVTPTSGLTTSETGGTATFTVVLDSEPTADVTIGLSSSDPTEGAALPASLTFTAANWSTPQTVTVTGVNDDIDDGHVAYSIITAAAVSADSNYSELDAADVGVTNQDDGDTAGITAVPISGLVTDETGGTATFTVALDSEPIADVTIGLSSSDPTEGTAVPGEPDVHGG